MTREEKLKAFEMKMDGYSLTEIADELGYTKQWISAMFQWVMDEKRKNSNIIYPEIYKFMKLRQYTITTLSKKLCYNVSTVSLYLRGKKKPSQKFIYSMEQLAHIDREKLFRREENVQVRDLQNGV